MWKFPYPKDISQENEKMPLVRLQYFFKLMRAGSHELSLFSLPRAIHWRSMPQAGRRKLSR